VDCLLPRIVEDEPYAVDEGYLSNCCRFMTLLMFMPPMSGGKHDLDMELRIEFRCRLFAGANPRMIVFMGSAPWKYLMLKKDLNPEMLRWFLLLQ